MGGLLWVTEESRLVQNTLSAVVAGEARIDTQAVMVSNQEGEDYSISLCQSLPIEAWKLLVILYIFLLIFNFREQCRLTGTVNTYLFESGLTLFFIIGWMMFDTCRTNTWFPLMLVKLGLIIFLLFQVKGLVTKHKDSH
jgi:hypothetical protein